MMRDIFDVLVAAASLCAGWWACDIYRSEREHDVEPLLPYPVVEPPSNVLSIVEDDGEGLIL